MSGEVSNNNSVHDYRALMFVPEKGQNTQNVTSPDKTATTVDYQPTDVNSSNKFTSGKVPSNGVELKPLELIPMPDKQTLLTEGQNPQVDTNNIDNNQLPSLDSIQPLSFVDDKPTTEGVVAKYDPNSLYMLTEEVPVTDEAGNAVLDEAGNPVTEQKPIMGPNNEPIYVVLDDNGEPKIDEKTGQPILVDKTGEPLANPAGDIMKFMDSHAMNRLMNGVMNKSLATSVMKTASNLLIKGKAISIPFTSKIVGFGLEYNIAKTLTSEVAKITTGKVATSGSTTIIKALGTAGEKTTEAALKTVATATTKATTETAGKGIINAVTSTFKASSAKASQEILEQSIKKGVEKGTSIVIKKGGKALAETVTKKTTEKILQNASTKVVEQTMVKGSTKVGSKIAAAIPYVNTAISAGITVWDGVDAYKKMTDPNVSGLSKTLACTTVGLDVATTVLTAKKTKPHWSLVTSILSIGTSIASDLTK